MKGVRAVITAKDCQEQVRHGDATWTCLLSIKSVTLVMKLQLLQPIRKRCIREALKLIKVEYEVLPVIDDPVKAMEPGAASVDDKPRNIIRISLRTRKRRRRLLRM